MLRRASLVVCLLLLTVTVLAKDQPREWKKGTLLDIRTEHTSDVVGANGVVVTTTDELTFYSIDDGSTIWELKRTNGKPLHVTVNASVEFAIDGDHAYLKDEDGKEHKTTVMKKTAKTKP